MEKTLFTNPFLGLPKSKLLQKKDVYIKLINEHSQADKPTDQKEKRFGQNVKKLTWMVPHYKRGLELINELL